MIIEILNFTFKSMYHFMGIFTLISMVLMFAFMHFEVFLKHRQIMKHGWPEK